MAEKIVLVINPGSASTKVALYKDGAEVSAKTLYHDEGVVKLPTVEQLKPRMEMVRDFMDDVGVSPSELTAVIGRGGPFKPLEGGTYEVNDALIKDIREGNVAADHISNLGSLMADEIAREAGIKAYFADPVSVDELIDEARLSGIPEVPRKSLLHALNIRAVSKRYCEEKGIDMSSLNAVVIHLGSGISVCAIRGGRIIDVNNANDGGPFSPERAGGLPTTGLIKLAFSGEYDLKGLLKYVTKSAGFKAYLGTGDLKEIMGRIDGGDSKAELVLRAFVYQVVKEAGAMSAVVDGEQEVIIITGGMAKSERLVDMLRERLNWLAPIKVYAGEGEMEALADAVFRVISGKEEVKVYQ
ncbi:MAG TPA: butyrate kinase [Firmicutes bacterium]|uniref:Probable butyrate kinase n=1 Tax=Candidatus Coatesbacteria bacterium 4484_99 TaxID=1970774 RepID=A0A1W9S1N6_9BACT|nr:MAG: butyrate kinase [Candidatus Coatesbacteria bacterium 4484_99]RLC39337.1 MAG: butyrate kinase [Candidatus Coatesbacteria bacterium]RLC42725.1 MAG: butyrate kinase [Candidatus Coatesbacteria bacterium]HDM43167.1 butyrate kinase [Bacillota bacterium]